MTDTLMQVARLLTAGLMIVQVVMEILRLMRGQTHPTTIRTRAMRPAQADAWYDPAW